MPPPSIFLILNALLIILLLPIKTDPIGQPKPLLRQTEIVSNILPTSRGLSFLCTIAFQILAPSKCMPRLFEFATFCIFFNSPISQQAPPPLFVVFSIAINFDKGL